jgi:hypothetical protein
MRYNSSGSNDNVRRDNDADRKSEEQEHNGDRGVIKRLAKGMKS